MTHAWDGRPENPERDGWHWLAGVTERPAAFEWLAHRQGWLFDRAQHNTMPPGDFANWRYLGPCLTPDEMQAALATARREAVEEAARVASERGAWASNDADADNLVDRLEARGRMDMAAEVAAAIRALAGRDGA